MCKSSQYVTIHPGRLNLSNRA